jgi:hypothetical protein
MQIYRRFRRYLLTRTSLFSLTLFSTLSTMLLIHKYFSITFFLRQYEIDKIFIIDEIDLEDARIKTTKNIYLLHKEFFNTTRLTCRYPKLTIDNQDIWKHLQPVTKSKPDCEKATNWVYVDNGLFNKTFLFLYKSSSL